LVFQGEEIEDFNCIKEQIMAEVKPSREEAFSLLKEYNKSEGLIKHALAVEGVMRYCARKRGEDEETWGIIGLVHDLDYEQFPEQHCRKTEEILTSHNWPAEYIRAVVSHGWGICTDVEPQSELEKFLYTVDELVGLVVATALVRPSRSVMDMKAKSVKKKWKDKSFAAGVNRAVIEKGAEMLGLELSEIITDVIMGMREVADEIGLRGNC
jgi:predicted hydrolase (HD superfamily)